MQRRQLQCADCNTGMLLVPYMKDPTSKRVWLDRCPKCRAIWFDAGEPEAAAGHHLPVQVLATEAGAPCPVCAVPLREATLASAPALACVKCGGVHLKLNALSAVQYKDDLDEEPTLKPPALFECVVCKRTFSLDQGDGVTCNGCATAKTGAAIPDSEAAARLSRRIGLTSLLEELFR